NPRLDPSTPRSGTQTTRGRKGRTAPLRMTRLGLDAIRRPLQGRFFKCERWQLVGFAEGGEVDAELLAFFIEVAAFEAESFRNVRHVEVMPANVGEEDFFFEGFGTFGERTG